MYPGDVASVKVGLVVPSYGYSNLLPEMASSILSQRCDVGFRAVLVDDGDSDPALIELCTSYAAAEPGVFHYLRPRRNGGLSATRNRGIDYLLETFPNIEMVMFPDADDRMLAGFIQKSYDRFVEARARAAANGGKLGWVFEHPNIFGEPGRMTRVTQHSMLWNMVGATQMPSSALSAEMYRDGLRYDESLVWGGEDWEFSIRALNAGFEGVYAPDQGFHWRRRPGSMSSSERQVKARGHNRTFIKLSNKPMFRRDYVWRRLERENPPYCILAPNGFRTCDAMSGFAAASRSGARLEPFSALAALLNNAQTHPSDPCPQSFYVIERTQAGGHDLPVETLNDMLLWSEFLLAQGFAVTHVFDDALEGRALPALKRGDDTQDRPFAKAVPFEHFVTLLQGRAVPAGRQITLRWPRPQGGKVGLWDGLRRKLFKRWREIMPVSEQMDAILPSLGAVGYAYGRPRRFGHQAWRPQGLTWRSVAGHLTEVPSQVLTDTGRLGLRIVLCGTRHLGSLLAELEGHDGPPVDVMVDTGRSDPLAIEGLETLKARGIVGEVFYLPDGVADEVDLREFGLNILGLYDTVLHWRSLAYVDELGRLSKLGVKNRLVLRQADLRASFQNFSSAFKCFDAYHIAPPCDDEAEAIAALQARGVARKSMAFGNPLADLRTTPG